MHIPVGIFQRAMEMYLAAAYPAGGGGVPAAVAERVTAFTGLGAGEVPVGMLEQSVAEAAESWALRLGQPLYPHMKLVVDPVPGAGGTGGGCRGYDFLLRVDAHDRHLHAPPSSPDAAWLAGIRASNKALVDKIEGDWAAAGLPTFKEYLRNQLEARKKAAAN